MKKESLKYSILLENQMKFKIPRTQVNMLIQMNIFLKTKIRIQKQNDSKYKMKKWQKLWFSSNNF